MDLTVTSIKAVQQTSAGMQSRLKQPTNVQPVYQFASQHQTIQHRNEMNETFMVDR